MLYKSSLVLMLTLLWSPVALAASPAAGPDRGVGMPRPSQGGPAARTGFQMSIDTGISVPMGRATGGRGDTLAARYSLHWPLLIDLGAKLGDNVYLGAYLGFSVGVEGNDSAVEQACDDRDSDLNNDVSCSSASFRAGLNAKYYFTPAAQRSFWLGYGIGPTFGIQSIRDSARGRREETTVSGIEFARLGAGLDFRLGRVFGVGPFVNVALGRYASSRTEVNGNEEYNGAIDQPAVHAWTSVGVRGVFFP